MAKTAGASQAGAGQAALKQPTTRRLDELRFDPLNPRLPDGYDDATQPELLEVLSRDYDLTEIGLSLAANGYFAEEPLVVVKESGQSRYTVLEGNRRLAALTLLDNPGRAKVFPTEWQELAASRAARVTSVPTIEYTRREDVVPYLGFRHITGVLQWRPYQKARFIAGLVEGPQGGKTFAEIARLIGIKAREVREHYVAFTIVRQAQDVFDIEIQSAEESFGVLRRALSNGGIREFVGVDWTKGENHLRRPVPKDKAPALRELFVWMFGTKAQKPVFTDSRDLNMLGPVLASNIAVSVLRSGGNLEHAYSLVEGEDRRLVDMLSKASFNLDQALPLVLRLKEEPRAVAAFRRCEQTFLAIQAEFARR